MHDNIKRLLGITGDDRDGLIYTITDSVEARLKVLLGSVEEIPECLEYIVDEVSVIRFNRIGSEGMSSHSVEGESVSYSDNDFAGFADEIKAFLDTQQSTSRGRLRFL